MLKKEEESLGFSIKDTEFLLRLIATATISGSELSQGADTLGKLKALHKELMEKTVEIDY